jgi:hypothetical protein
MAAIPPVQVATGRTAENAPVWVACTPMADIPQMQITDANPPPTEGLLWPRLDQIPAE